MPWVVAAGTVVALLGAGLAWVTLGDGRTARTGDAGSSPSTAASAAADVTPSATTPSPSASPVKAWWSGASSDESADGRFGRWRGTDVAIGGTWDNGNAEQVAMRTICPGGPWASWNKPLDVAIGAIEVDRGESWAAAARGAYDSRWQANLTKMKQCWGTRDPSLLYIRFAHEMNLPLKWRVRGGEEGAFVQAITRYSNLRYTIMPQAKIVLCPNDGTDAGLGGLDIRKLWPGKDAQGRPVADVYAVDSYNMNPHVTTTAAFTKKINAQYANGVPLGLEKHRQFAEQAGVPFAVGEWGNNGDPGNAGGGGESPEYVRDFHAWAAQHAGDPANPAPGQLLYEVQFNLWGQYALWPRTQQPRTAAAYRGLPWGRVGD